MKKLSILFLSLVALGAIVVSCSKNDDSTASKIQGKWAFDTYTYTDADGTSASQLAYETACPDRKYFDFKSGNVLGFGIANPANDPANPCKFYTYTGTWKLENNMLSTTVEGDTKQVAIVSVSSTDLVFKYPQPNNEYYTYTLKKS